MTQHQAPLSDREPARLYSAITAALSSTVGVLVLTDVVSEKVGGGLTVALSAWVLVAAELIRSRVRPMNR